MQVAVKTPNGLTDRVNIEEIILQGDVFGPIECSVTVDSFGKECLEEQKHLYYYKGKTPVPLLTIVDDALAVTECGYETDMMNAYLNTKTSIKKLQYGVSKCFKMHVGRSCNKDICNDLFVDGWRVENVTEVETGKIEEKDEYDGLHAMEEVNSEKYLGDILSNDGKNTKNINARKNRGIGLVTQIMTKLEETCFGKFFFKVAIILRNSHLISSLLTNAEAWYNLTTAEIEILEGIHESFMRRVLEAPISTPKEIIYLELGIVPIRYIIRMRRLNFLQYILHEEEHSLVHSVLKTQLENPTPGDWGMTCLKDLKEFDIKWNICDIENMSSGTFRNLVQKKAAFKSLEYLNKIKGKHTKVMNIPHKKLMMQNYLETKLQSRQEAKFLFALRCRMIDVKVNYKNKYSDNICPCCHVEVDDQEHLLSCSELDEEGTLVGSSPHYQDLFGNNIEKQINIARILKKRFELRKVLKRMTPLTRSGPGDRYVNGLQ